VEELSIDGMESGIQGLHAALRQRKFPAPTYVAGSSSGSSRGSLRCVIGVSHSFIVGPGASRHEMESRMHGRSMMSRRRCMDC